MNDWSHRLAILTASVCLHVYLGSRSVAASDTGRGEDTAGTLIIERLDEDTPRSLRRVFVKRVVVFGIPVFASQATPDAKVLHAANVLAQYLDNDEDGKVDNQRVVVAMKEHGAGIQMFATEREARRSSGDRGDFNLQGLYGEETRPDGAAHGQV